MLTLVRQQPRTATVSWDKVIRLGRRASEQVAVWHSRRRELDALSRLDDHLLADIGLTREQQMSACSRLFWWPCDRDFWLDCAVFNYADFFGRSR